MMRDTSGPAGGVHKPGDAGGLQKLEEPRKQIFPQSLQKKKKRMQPCPDFDLGPLGILSEFWSLNLCCFNHCYFGVKFVAVCYSNNSELCSVSSQTNMLTLSFPLLAPWDVDTGSGGMAAFLQSCSNIHEDEGLMLGPAESGSSKASPSHQPWAAHP